MKITSQLFEAFLKCPTKCYLRSQGEAGSGNEYAEWVHGQKETYEQEAVRRMAESLPETERVVAPVANEHLKTAQWRLALNLTVQTPDRSADSHVRELELAGQETRGLGGPRSGWQLESRLHAVERVPAEGRGRPAQFIPIRFIFRNKLTTDDRLLLAFDALVLSQVLGREVSLGKIIHGENHATLKVKPGARTAASARTAPTSKGLAAEVRKRLDKITALFSGQAGAQSTTVPRGGIRESLPDEETRGLGGPRSEPAPPDLVLNRHCGECEFRDRCRKIAIEKDDLSLLANMSAKERQKLRSKGIFTVTQLSYTFRPRRRPKRLRDKREKYHHSLKALAIREQKIHIVGSPELKIEGTPVYLDVEGLPDRDFYYLIGLRIGHGEDAVQHSLWADTVADEAKIWREFLAILETIEKPVLIHYGSYETTFSKQMAERHGSPQAESVAAKAIAAAINIVSVMFAKIYLPTFSNGLKAVADFLGFKWSEAEPTGLKSIIWRNVWAGNPSPQFRERLVTYNAEDCQALEVLMRAMLKLGAPQSTDKPLASCAANVVHTESIPRETMFGRFSTSISEFEQINKAARWDYQRDRVYVRLSKRIRRIANRKQNRSLRPDFAPKLIIYREPEFCPSCGQKGFRHFPITRRVLFDIYFGRFNVRRRFVEYSYHVHWCAKCRARFGIPLEFWPESKYGRNLVAYLIYHIIELSIPMAIIRQSANRLFGMGLTQTKVHNLRVMATRYYAETRQTILDKLTQGKLLHVDETRVSVKGKTAYVWVFTSLHEVAYVYADTREGEFVKALLRSFTGVLVSDFYSAYDSVECLQQKCLLHLMRDLNDQVLDQPYDEELKEIVKGFAEVIKPIVETVDQYGLKRHFLTKHRVHTNRFFRQLAEAEYNSEVARKCSERFERNRDKLFTFLEHDGVPWNNNNAEHAIKAFAGLRDVVQGSWTPKAVEEYLVLLSVCQTCKYMGVDFLDFLRSGEKDIHAFAESRRGRRRRTQTSQTNPLSPSTTADEVGGA